MDLQAIRDQAAQDITAASSRGVGIVPTVMGFDGFIDHIIDVVDTRQSNESYQPLATISDFGQRVIAAAGHSTNFELVVKQTKIGGNGPIMANALATLGHDMTYIGVLGEGEVHQAFAPLAAKASSIHNLGAPASTDALEFQDGKLMMGKLEPLDCVNVDKLRQAVGDDRIVQLFTGASCVATVNWTMLLSMTDIWDYLIREILPKRTGPQPWWFVDLADPAKRSVDDLIQALETLRRLGGHVKVALGLNEAEARQVLGAIGRDWEGASEDLTSAQEAAETMRDELGLSRIVIHMKKGAAGAAAGESAAVEGFFTPTPKIATGAGDHFNAGYLWAVCAGMCEASALTVACATSGHYVRTAISPQASNLLALLSRS